MIKVMIKAKLFALKNMLLIINFLFNKKQKEYDL